MKQFTLTLLSLLKTILSYDLKTSFFFYVKENVIYLIWLVLVVNCVIVSIPD